VNLTFNEQNAIIILFSQTPMMTPQNRTPEEEQAMPAEENPTPDTPVPAAVPIEKQRMSRRGALGRMLGFGGAAVVATALPGCGGSSDTFTYREPEGKTNAAPVEDISKGKPAGMSDEYWRKLTPDQRNAIRSTQSAMRKAGKVDKDNRPVLPQQPKGEGDPEFKLHELLTKWDLLDVGGLSFADLVKYGGGHYIETRMQMQTKDPQSKVRLAAVNLDTIKDDPDALIDLQGRINAAITRLEAIESNSHYWNTGKTALKALWWGIEGLGGYFGWLGIRRLIGAIIGVVASHAGTSKLAQSQQEEVTRIFTSIKSELEAKGREVAHMLAQAQQAQRTRTENEALGKQQASTREAQERERLSREEAKARAIDNLTRQLSSNTIDFEEYQRRKKEIEGAM